MELFFVFFIFFKIYNNTDKAKYSINCCSGIRPIFFGGDCDIIFTYFPIDTNINSLTNYKKSDISYGKLEKDYEINNGEKNFTIQELGIFQILFD